MFIKSECTVALINCNHIHAVGVTKNYDGNGCAFLEVRAYMSDKYITLNRSYDPEVIDQYMKKLSETLSKDIPILNGDGNVESKMSL